MWNKFLLMVLPIMIIGNLILGIYVDPNMDTIKALPIALNIIIFVIILFKICFEE